jgi:hypothetical protein
MLLVGRLTGHVIRRGGHYVAKTGAFRPSSAARWEPGPWVVLIAWLAGLVVFAVATWWRGMLGARGALAVTLPAIACVAAFAVGILGQVDRLTGSLIFATAITALVPMWLAVGGALQWLPDAGDLQEPPLDPVPGPTIA